MQAAAVRVMTSFARQFPGVSVREPAIVGRQRLDSGKEFLRLKFRVWPNRGGPLETTFRQELEAELKRENPDYQAWMIAVAYEIEARTAARHGLSSLLRRADAAEDRTERRRAGNA
jgi:small conductance mechanosensitive channel